MRTQHLLHPVLFLVALQLAACSAPGVEVGVRALQLDLSGDIGASSGATVATSTADRLGLADDPIAVSPRVDLVGGPMRLTVDAFRSQYDGEGTADADFTLDGLTIAAGTDVISELDLGLVRAAATFTVLPLGPVHLGLGIGAALFDIDASLEDINTGDRVQTDQLAPVPFLAGRVGAELGIFSLDVLVGYLEVDVGEVDASYLDLDAMARIRLFRSGVHGHLVGGYRWIALDAEYDDGSERVRADLELSGPYIGISLGF